MVDDDAVVDHAAILDDAVILGLGRPTSPSTSAIAGSRRRIGRSAGNDLASVCCPMPAIVPYASRPAIIGRAGRFTTRPYFRR
ncbi:hypothetical protein WEI85_43235 [Actinomycetes bacterium KLBMP 9797]